MYCLVCQELINKRITYKNIFKQNIHKICDNCFSRLIFIQELIVYPINNYLLYLNVLFDKSSNEYALMNFLKPYYIYYLKNREDKIILYFDIYSNVIYDKISKINFGNIYMITLSKTKENDYED
ncbi:hypothetical protein [Haploplasma axanthum]|uniref:hypothetical protein n=1 Tax=Haploplasma axanthum TaxID=29552 RepID=UPI00138AE263|nr:hypothetical protein [Haploplasma axanthum]